MVELKAALIQRASQNGCVNDIDDNCVQAGLRPVDMCDYCLIGQAATQLEAAAARAAQAEQELQAFRAKQTPTDSAS